MLVETPIVAFIFFGSSIIASTLPASSNAFLIFLSVNFDNAEDLIIKAALEFLFSFRKEMPKAINK